MHIYERRTISRIYIYINHLQFSDEKHRTPILNCTELLKKKKKTSEKRYRNCL